MVTGRRLGPYEVLAKLGEGGMGAVYRARDTKLQRDVALKVLLPEVAHDPERLARFRREAQTLAALNHPHIAGIYGLEEVPGGPTDPPMTALAMELVEGEDLAERLARGPMPVDEALPIARQIAEALEAAHEQGIVHRDLKPANIKVRADGTVKVLDFGLAKALVPDGAGGTANASASMSPTMTSPAMTRMGMVLGTAAYMAPEQARGRPADKRADIWAFGCVLYEMLTGRRAFEDDDVTSTLASVLRDDVAWEALPYELPAPLQRLLRRCLDRDPRTRLRDIGEARILLEDPAAREAALPVPAAAAPVAASHRLPWSVATAATAIAVLAVAWSATRPGGAGDDAPRGVVTFPLTADADLRETTSSTSPFAISRDGRTVVFAARNDKGTHLWVRSLGDPAPRMLPNTENASNPALSPNGEWVAFVDAGTVIRKIRIDGSGASTVASIDGSTFSLAWRSDEDLVFEVFGPRRASGGSTGIQQVAATGGTPALLIPLDASAAERRQRRPLVLPDHEVVLYTSTVGDRPDTLVAFSLRDRRTIRLAVEGTQALGVIEDHLIYSRGDGFLMAAPFDLRRLRITGPAIQLKDQVLSSPAGTAVTLSASGTLVHAPASLELSQLMLGTAAGDWTPLGNWIRAFEGPRFSPDGTRVAVGIVSPDGSRDLWVLDLGSAEPTRVTRGEQASLCGWRADGLALVYARNDGRDGVWTVPVGSGDAPSRLLQADALTRVLGASPRGVSGTPDGKWVVVVGPGGQGQTVLARVSLAEGTGEVIGEEPGPVMTRREPPRVSADSRWVAFSDNSDVYVRALAGGAHVQVSDAGGRLPVWSLDGRRLFYQAPAGLVAASLDVGTGIRVSSRIPLTTIPPDATIADASPDGKTLLLQSPVSQGPRALVVVDWADAVRHDLRARQQR